MTFPVGPLPSAGAISQAEIATRFKSATFTHAGSDLDLTDPANGVAPCAFELWCVGTGNIVAVLAGDVTAAGVPTARTYPVVAGTVLKGAFVLIKSTSTADCIARQ